MLRIYKVDRHLHQSYLSRKLPSENDWPFKSSIDRTEERKKLSRFLILLPPLHFLNLGDCIFATMRGGGRSRN
ncbi:hypothetical protein MKW98_006948 [Papaver atlanticum]|uniref:Uncharacterized protein n=1 Tax=Papaver atlanticum TaxID=357466 RepID=A0AAD4SUW8_9MAGN|nr:hypothetical protein MKW98_006948 [Papaver atlanticum]